MSGSSNNNLSKISSSIRVNFTKRDSTTVQLEGYTERNVDGINIQATKDGKFYASGKFDGTWNSSVGLATKSDLDSYFKTLSLPSNGTVTYTPTNFCIIIAENFKNMTFSFVHIESAGAWVLPIKENETISISVDDSNRKNLLIKNNNSSSGRIFILNFKS